MHGVEAGGGGGVVARSWARSLVVVVMVVIVNVPDCETLAIAAAIRSQRLDVMGHSACRWSVAGMKGLTDNSTTIDPDAFQHLVEGAVGDLGSVSNAAPVVVGDRLGLYRAIAEAGTVTSAELAARTGTAERNVREWLSALPPAGCLRTMVRRQRTNGE